MIIRGMNGLGDNINQRPFVKNLPRPVYLETPWPEIYGDLPRISFVRPQTRLRTQAKNVARHRVWARAGGPSKRIFYSDKGIWLGLEKSFGVPPGPFDLPAFPSPVSGAYAVVRPATIRTEWLAESRNPAPEYLCEAAEIVRSSGTRIVSVADLKPSVEWAVGPLPEADLTYHAGELDVRQLLGLIQHASVVIGGVGWILPACIASKVSAWIIFGGWGLYNAPDKLMDRRMDVSRIGCAIPDKFCRCGSNRHKCDKRISNHAASFAGWFEGIRHAGLAA